MVFTPEDTQLPNISVDVGKPAAKRSRHRRKKLPVAIWFLIGSCFGLLVILAGVAWSLRTNKPIPLAIPAIADQEIIQGQTAWLQDPREPSLSAGSTQLQSRRCPEDATVDGERGVSVGRPASRNRRGSTP